MEMICKTRYLEGLVVWLVSDGGYRLGGIELYCSVVLCCSDISVSCSPNARTRRVAATVRAAAATIRFTQYPQVALIMSTGAYGADRTANHAKIVTVSCHGVIMAGDRAVSSDQLQRYRNDCESLPFGKRKLHLAYVDI
jgi:hypothetical protein